MYKNKMVCEKLYIRLRVNFISRYVDVVVALNLSNNGERMRTNFDDILWVDVYLKYRHFRYSQKKLDWECQWHSKRMLVNLQMHLSHFLDSTFPMTYILPTLTKVGHAFVPQEFPLNFFLFFWNTIHTKFRMKKRF